MAQELVSALMDSECSAQEVRRLVQETAASPQLMQQWSRMQLARDVLSGRATRAAATVDADQFCAGIMARLGSMEPIADVADAAAAPAQARPMPTASKVVALPSRAPIAAAPRRMRRSRPLVGWAAAASFTLVAVAGGRAWIGGSEPAATSAQTLAANESSDSGQLQGSGNSRGGLVPVSSREPTELRWAQLNPDQARELNGYMMEHNSSRADQGMNGALGYARLAARNVDYRSSNEAR